MKRKLILLALLLYPTFVRAETQEEYTTRICDGVGLYSLVLYGCPNFNLRVDLTVPLCKQPDFQHLSYLDHRCYEEVPFDYSKQCFEWDCPVPYVHKYLEPITGRTKEYRGSWEELDQHYRAARSQLGGPKAKKKKNSK